MRKLDELPIPDATRFDSHSREIARVWVAGGKQWTSLASGIWDDPAAWGIMLVDLARHIADSYDRDEGRSSSDVLARIKEGFDVEWEHPTDKPKGM